MKDTNGLPFLAWERRGRRCLRAAWWPVLLAVGGTVRLFAATPPALRPIFRAIPLTAQRPADTSAKVKYRSARPLFAQFRYGADDSNLVTVVVDPVPRSQFDLYVDADRDRIIEPAELVPGKGPTRQMKLEAEFVEGDELRRVPRTVLFRFGRIGRTLSFATADFARHRTVLAGRTVSIVRVDGDANGFFSDRRDRLWIDRNGDGRWDPLKEQFPYAPLLVLDGRRFAVRGDRLGARITFREVSDTGALRLGWTPRAGPFRVEKLEVLVVGEDGAAFTLTQPGQTVTVPTGRYALEAVSLVLRPNGSETPWLFVFNRYFGGQPERWHSVRRDQTVTIHPFAGLRFELRVDENDAAEPGQELTITPRLLTADGLTLNASWFGQADRLSPESRFNVATIRLVDATGKVLASVASGFS